MDRKIQDWRHLTRKDGTQWRCDSMEKKALANRLRSHWLRADPRMFHLNPSRTEQKLPNPLGGRNFLTA